MILHIITGLALMAAFYVIFRAWRNENWDDW